MGDIERDQRSKHWYSVENVGEPFVRGQVAGESLAEFNEAEDDS